MSCHNPVTFSPSCIQILQWNCFAICIPQLATVVEGVVHEKNPWFLSYWGSRQVVATTNKQTLDVADWPPRKTRNAALQHVDDCEIAQSSTCWRAAFSYKVRETLQAAGFVAWWEPYVQKQEKVSAQEMKRSAVVNVSGWRCIQMYETNVSRGATPLQWGSISLHQNRPY